MNSSIDEFHSRNAEVFGVSMDSVHTNRAYAESMGGLKFPLLADWHPHGGLTRQVGVLLADKNCASRTTVVVDKEGLIRDISTNPLGEDRDFAQTLEVLDRIHREQTVKV